MPALGIGITSVSYTHLCFGGSKGDVPWKLIKKSEDEYFIFGVTDVYKRQVYSIVETAKANGLNPYKYLLLIFRDMPGVLFKQYPEFLEDYLPWSPEVQKACK